MPVMRKIQNQYNTWYTEIKNLYCYFKNFEYFLTKSLLKSIK